MIRVNDIQDKLFHLIGWKQSYDTSEEWISEELTESETGMYFQQVHPLLTLKNIESIAPDFKNVKFPEYDSSAEIRSGSIVTFSGKLYKSVVDSPDEAPGESQDWIETNPLSEWLVDKTKSGIINAITRFCSDGQSLGIQKPLCENKVLFDGTGRLSDTVKNKGNIVGFEVVPVRSKGVTTVINKIGLQFTKPGVYTIYLLHSSQDGPVKELTLEKRKENSFEWFNVNLNLPYVGDGTDAGGSWYIVYKQSELPDGSEAIVREKDWSKGPCGSCSRRDLIAWQAWSKYIEVHPFYESEADLLSGSDFSLDQDRMVYTYNSNYGINLEVSVGCDITDFIIDQRVLFRDVIAKQVAVDMLREFAYNSNVRTNRNSVNVSRMDVLYELDGDSASLKKSGLGYQLEMAFKAIRVSLSGIDRICLPCKNNGVRYRTV